MQLAIMAMFLPRPKAIHATIEPKMKQKSKLNRKSKSTLIKGTALKKRPALKTRPVLKLRLVLKIALLKARLMLKTRKTQKVGSTPKVRSTPKRRSTPVMRSAAISQTEPYLGSRLKNPNLKMTMKPKPKETLMTTMIQGPNSWNLKMKLMRTSCRGKLTQ
jgi:hypothetical protein